MTMLDDIRRDREAGTPGPWWVCIDDDGNPLSGRPSVQAPKEYDCAIVHWDGFVQTYWRSARGDKEIHANARRIARVPQLEAALLAAEELATAIDRAFDLDAFPPNGYQISVALAAFRAAMEARDA